MSFSKWKLAFQTYKFFFYGLTFLVFCAASAEILVVLQYPRYHGLSLFKTLSASGFLVSLILALGLIAFFYRSMIKPQKEINEQKQVFKNDCSNLKISFSELAEGDLTRNLSIASTPLSTAGSNGMASIIGIINEVVAELHQLSEEYNSITDIPCQRLCYVGANRFTEGRRAGQIMGSLLNGKGEVAVDVSSFENLGPMLRFKGFQSYLNSHCPDIKIIKAVESKEHDELTYNHVHDLIEKYPKFNGYYLTQGTTPHSAARAVMEAGRMDKIKIIAHDLNDETLFYLKKGIIQATIGQNPLLQGHNPVIHLYNNLTAGWTPTTPLLYTQLDVVTPDNYAQFWQYGTGEILSVEIYDRMAKIIKKEARRPMRIAVIGREHAPFWNTVKKGVFQAASKLKIHGVKVEWIIPENSKKGADIRASIYGPVIESLVAQKVDGIAVVAADRNLIPYINRATKAGIPVVTFSADPDSLRSVFCTISEQAKKLKTVSRKLIDNMHSVNQTTHSIENEMINLDKRSIEQNSQIQNMRASLNSFVEYMDQINRESKTARSTTESVWQSLMTGSDTLENTFASIKIIEQTIQETWKTVEKLNKHSERIEMIIKLIDGISSRINILALNASIESAKTQDHGKAFGDVAEEIRKLARNTNESTKEIAGLLNTLQGGMIKADRLLKSDLNRIHDSESKTEETKIHLAQIRSAVQKEDTRIRKITQAIEEMQGASHQVGDGMSNVSFISGKNTAAVKQVTGANNELISSLKAVTQLSLTLEKMAKSEEDLLAKFTIM